MVLQRWSGTDYDTAHSSSPRGFDLIECVGGEWNIGGSRDYQRFRAYSALHSVILFCASLADAVRENDRWLFYGWQADDYKATGKCVRQWEDCWTCLKWVSLESKDLMCHEGPVSYLWCSCGGKPVSLDLQLGSKEETTSHLVSCAGLGGDPRWSWRVPLWEMCIPVGEGGTM